MRLLLLLVHLKANKAFKNGLLTVGCRSFLTILANNYQPLNVALVVRTRSNDLFFALSAQHKLLGLVQFFGLAMEVPFNIHFLFAQPSFRLA